MKNLIEQEYINDLPSKMLESAMLHFLLLPKPTLYRQKLDGKKSQTMVDTFKALRKVKKKWKKWIERALWNGMHGELHVKMPSWKLKTRVGGLMRKNMCYNNFHSPL